MLSQAARPIAFCLALGLGLYLGWRLFIVPRPIPTATPSSAPTQSLTAAPTGTIAVPPTGAVRPSARRAGSRRATGA